MIKYDSHIVSSLLQLKGSVLPKTLVPSIMLSVLSFVLKYAENEGNFELDGLKLVLNSAVYSGFTFILGFIIVFRTSQSYGRFTVAASAINRMRTTWWGAANNLCNFTLLADNSEEEITNFRHIVVRLFSALHAVSLASVAAMEDENFTIIDVSALDQEALSYLLTKEDEDKVEVVYTWLQCTIVRGIQSGILCIPPPILSRVFQELEIGLLEYHQVLQIMDIPFPFPYAQVTFVLVQIYTLMTPFVMSMWATSPIVAAIFTFISILGVRSVNSIATQLENPVGDDPNDLPCHEFHKVFNQKMLMLLDPMLYTEMNLNELVTFDHKQLVKHLADKEDQGLQSLECKSNNNSKTRRSQFETASGEAKAVRSIEPVRSIDRSPDAPKQTPRLSPREPKRSLVPNPLPGELVQRLVQEVVQSIVSEVEVYQRERFKANASQEYEALLQAVTQQQAEQMQTLHDKLERFQRDAKATTVEEKIPSMWTAREGICQSLDVRSSRSVQR